MLARLLILCFFLTVSLQALAQQRSERQAWGENCRLMPDLKAYRTMFLDPTPLDELMAWVPEGQTVRVYDEKCSPIELRRHEGRLAGDVEIRTSIEKGVKRVSARTAHYGLDVSYTGPGWTEYKKDAKGKWVEVGGGGMGCLETRPGALSRVTKQGAFYDGALVTLEVVCCSTYEEVGTCRNGKKRSCKRCVGLQLQAKSESPGVGFGYGRGPVMRGGSSEPLDCSKPCPPDELTPKAEELNRYLKGKRFIKPDMVGSPAALFRSLKACRRYRKTLKRK